MNYPGLPKHHINELEWIKQRYNELLIRQTNGRVDPVVKAREKKELIAIDQERTEIYLLNLKL